MADNFDAFPTVTDDDGSLTTGTPFSNAYNALLKATIADQVYSVVNPAVKPRHTTEEVVNARGSLGNLETRLDVATNPDGTLKAIAGQATVADLVSQQGARNLIRNGDMEMWTDGDVTAPDYWESSGAGVQVARAGPGRVDTQNVGAGHSSANIISGGALGLLVQKVWISSDVGYRSAALGRRVVLSGILNTSVAAAARIVVQDGVSNVASAYHTGGGTDELLSAALVLSGSATLLQVYVGVNAAGVSAHVGGLQLVFSDEEQTAWIPEPSRWSMWHNCIIARYEGTEGNSSTGETDLWALLNSVPPWAISRDGQGFRITATFSLAQNVNVKTGKLYLGSNSVTFLSSNSSVANNIATLHATVVRASGTTAVVIGTITFDAATGAVPTVQHFAGSISGINWAAALVLKITGQSDTATDDLRLIRLICEWMP